MRMVARLANNSKTMVKMAGGDTRSNDGNGDGNDCHGNVTHAPNNVILSNDGNP